MFMQALLILHYVTEINYLAELFTWDYTAADLLGNAFQRYDTP